MCPTRTAVLRDMLISRKRNIAFSVQVTAMRYYLKTNIQIKIFRQLFSLDDLPRSGTMDKFFTNHIGLPREHNGKQEN